MVSNWFENLRTMQPIPKPSAVRRDASATIRLYIKDAGLQPGDQLPAERELAIILGIARGRLRNALGRMKARGEVWQHVGKGTFVGESPLDPEAASLRAGPILDRTTPLEVVDARILLEPRLAAMAAVRGTQVDFAAMAQWVRRGAAEKDYPSSHRAGDAWHRAVAIATHSELLLWMFDHLFMIRGAIHWGRLPPEFHEEDVQAIWNDHQQLTEAMAARDAALAERLMRRHLEDHRQRVLAFVP